jgi:DNA-binding MarR family transcriptional regulator
MGEVLRNRLKQPRFESPIHEVVLNLLVAAGHVRERMDRVCARHDITHGQYNVLRILGGAHPGGYPRCEIARRMVERAPDVTRLIDRLERQGLVERGRSAEDRRLSVTRITTSGIELLDRMRPAIDAVHGEIGSRLSHRDGRELSRILEGLYPPEE